MILDEQFRDIFKSNTKKSFWLAFIVVMFSVGYYREGIYGAILELSVFIGVAGALSSVIDVYFSFLNKNKPSKSLYIIIPLSIITCSYIYFYYFILKSH